MTEEQLENQAAFRRSAMMSSKLFSNLEQLDQLNEENFKEIDAGCLHGPFVCEEANQTSSHPKALAL